MRAHELLEPLFVEHGFNGGQLLLVSSQPMNFHKLFTLLVAVPGLKEVDYADVICLVTILTGKSMSLKARQLCRRVESIGYVNAGLPLYLTRINLYLTLDTKQQRIVHNAQAR